MLVEDDNNLREIYGARLAAEGYEIVSAQDGEEALAIAVKEKPDLIISDVMMPRISGFDMLDILRNAPETKDTKVIMMTALSQAEDKSRADKLGADRYLVKSQVTLEDVTNVVHEVLGDVPADDKSEQPAAAVEGNTTTTSTPQPLAPTPAATPPAAPAPQPAAPAEPPAPTVDAITNPDIQVAEEDNASGVQAPPADEPAGLPVATPPVTTTDDSSTVATNDSQTQASTDPPQVSPSVTDDAVSMPATSTDTATATTPDPATSQIPPASESAQTETINPADIKVELPTPETSVPEPVAPPAPTIIEPQPEPASTDSSSTPASIGPNLAEALAAEEKQFADSETNLSAADDTRVATPPAPSVSNGAPTPTVITPSEPAPQIGKMDSATKIPVTAPSETTSSAPQTPKREVGGGKVIQPINDPTATPDLEALLAAEEQKAGITNPAASSVIAPQQSEVSPTPNQPDAQKPSNDLNNISI